MMDIKKGRYLHYKGREYKVLYMAKHSETLEVMVVYKALYGAREYGCVPRICGEKASK